MPCYKLPRRTSRECPRAASPCSFNLADRKRTRSHCSRRRPKGTSMISTWQTERVPGSITSVAAHSPSAMASSLGGLQLFGGLTPMMPKISHQENDGNASNSALLLTINCPWRVGSSITRELVAGTMRWTLSYRSMGLFTSALYSCSAQAARTSSTS